MSLFLYLSGISLGRYCQSLANVGDFEKKDKGEGGGRKVWGERGGSNLHAMHCQRLTISKNWYIFKILDELLAHPNYGARLKLLPMFNLTLLSTCWSTYLLLGIYFVNVTNLKLQAILLIYCTCDL